VPLQFVLASSPELVARLAELNLFNAHRVGPTFVKIGRAVLYPNNELDAWDQKHTVTCGASKRLGITGNDAA
jgi:hypothetical protein